MRKTWYYKMLLSYLPIFFVVTFLILFLYFHSLSERNEKQIIDTHKLLGMEISQLVDTNLQAINVAFSRETVYNDDWRSFLANAGSEYYKYRAYSRIGELMASNRLIDSIYLINFKDEIVLGNSRPYSLAEFERFSFLKQRELDGYSPKWSNVHSGKLTSGELMTGQAQEEQRMITLYKKAGPLERDGLILINVDVGKLQQIVDRAYSPDLLKVQVVNEWGTVVLGGDKTYGEGADADIGSGLKVVDLKSAATGWTYQVGYERSWLFGLSSIVSNLGLLLAVVAVLLGGLTIVLVTRRHYQPIQQIMNRLFNARLDGLPGDGKSTNELKWIQTALVKYMDHSKQYEHLYLSEQELRSRYEARKMLDGSRGWDIRVWAAICERFELPADFAVRQCLLIELDDIGSFTRQYSEKDQELLRYVVGKAVREMAKGKEVPLFSDWISGERLLIVLFVADRQSDHALIVQELVQSLIDWVDRNLRFTVTIGVGAPVINDEKLPYSYAAAKASLANKFTFGKNRSFAYAEREINPMKELHDLISLIGQIVKSLMQGRSEWEDELRALLETMKRHSLSRDEILNLLQYLAYQIQKALAQHNEAIAAYWQAELSPSLEEKLQTEETLDELTVYLIQIITPLCRKIAEHHKSAKHYDLMKRVKEYVELHYCDDTLSLESLSDHFGIGDKYLSKLFKETLGINFGEFVTQLRLDKAKELLLQTSYSIHEVSQQVGYVNPLSFTRVFKRTLGMTPSELRQRNG